MYHIAGIEILFKGAKYNIKPIPYYNAASVYFCESYAPPRCFVSQVPDFQWIIYDPAIGLS